VRKYLQDRVKSGMYVNEMLEENAMKTSGVKYCMKMGKVEYRGEVYV